MSTLQATTATATVLSTAATTSASTATAASPVAASATASAAHGAAAPTSACALGTGRAGTYSIGRRLSNKLAALTMAILAALFACSWVGTASSIIDRREADLNERSMVIADIIELEARNGGEAAVLARVKADGPMRKHASLELWYADGRPLFDDAAIGPRAMSTHTHNQSFTIPAPSMPGGLLQARYTADYARDVAMGRRWALIFALTTLAAGTLVWLGTRWRVRQMLRPLAELAAMTRAIAPDALHARLDIAEPAEELLPWIEQFNALMGRLERAYAQLEAFNADVAHELRTPLATLMMQTELALSRERPAAELRETLACSLEELHRLSALVNDMLFLSQADRGATARRGEPVSLAQLAQDVIDFHEAALDEAVLRVAIDGDARVALDEPLVQRALSNLVGNATRYASRGSVVTVAIAAQPAGGARVTVHNDGPPIDAKDLPRLFTRFFRGDDARCCDGDEQHFGLGLAIVAAIARMHGGATFAVSDAAGTRIGFSLGG